MLIESENTISFGMKIQFRVKIFKHILLNISKNKETKSI